MNNIRLDAAVPYVYLRTNFAILQNQPLQLKIEAFMHDVKTVREPACAKKKKKCTGQTSNTRPTWQQQLPDGCPKTTVKTSHGKQR
jgi:hypothetical protein